MISRRSLFLCASVLSAFFSPVMARANDGIFPSAPAARKTVDFDGRGFIINGKRTFLASGGIEYARVPRALWRDRLLKFKRAGINCVEIYTFWNVHEPRPGQFNFSGDADLGAFLSLAQSLEMFAIVRVGPYYCAEWDSGGYPIWLRNVPGLEVRTDNEPFKRAVSAFFDHLLPIVVAHQINRGGNVVMVQLENEHPRGWGTEMPDGYFRFLRDKFVAAGGEVPYFFSGLHHSPDPANDQSWDSKGRTNPWFSTEFWPGWYDLYGALPETGERSLRRFDRATWKIIAYGGNGYNYYMLHGGTNFDYFNSNEDASSYDYGAAVGQAGDLRPIYYRFKRAATFANSFAEVLENSENADSKFQSIASEPKIKVTARQSDAGTLMFLDNPGDAPIQTRISAPDETQSEPVTIEAGELMPIVQNFSLAPGVKIDWAPTRVLGISRQRNITTLVVYGQVGSPAEVRFKVTGDLKTTSGDLIRGSGTNWNFKTNFADRPIEAKFSVGTSIVRVLALSPELADRTWFVEAGGANTIVSGPDFVGDVAFKNNAWQINTERPWNGATAFPITIYGADSKVLPPATPFRGDRLISLALSNWQTRSGTEPAQPRFDDAGWMNSSNPLQMGGDNDVSSYAWYRTHLNAPTAGKYTLTYGGGGSVKAFLDGKRLDDAVSQSGSVNLDLGVGEHTLAFFTSHGGRDKLFGHLGTLGDVDVKGISGAASLTRSQAGAQTLSDWKMHPADLKAPGTVPPPVDASWSDYKIGADAFDGKEGRAWFVTTLPPGNSAGGHLLHFGSVDENATVFVNGVKIGEHNGWNQSFDLEAGSNWKTNGSNQLAVLIYNQSYGGGIDQPVSILAYESRTPQMGWKMRGGPTGADETSSWKPLSARQSEARPQWYRANFVAPNSNAVRPIWRIKTRGLSRGSVWLNGHNLGRYPEKVPVDGLYLPESWLQNGPNTIEIFDEDGKSPQGVTIEAEADASRDLSLILGG